MAEVAALGLVMLPGLGVAAILVFACIGAILNWWHRGPLPPLWGRGDMTLQPGYKGADEEGAWRRTGSREPRRTRVRSTAV